MSLPDRRTVLRAGFLASGTLLAGSAAVPPAMAAPALVRSGRPGLTHGVQTGDVTAHGGIVWARADRPSRMLVELTGKGGSRRTVKGPVLTPDTDYTGKVRLRGLGSGSPVDYRVVLADLDDASLTSDPVGGSFTTAPITRKHSVRFTWSADLAGQGWGINPDLGGFRIFAAMRDLEPDFFLFSGDTVYADGPIQATVALPDGSTWRNIVTEEKAKVAETLAEYRGQYAYNLLDDNLKRFAAEVPQIVQWDDHEVTNNWYPGEVLVDDRYTEKRVDVLAARAKQAFHEWMPIAPIKSEGGRIYRRVPYGPLLDVLVLDMRSYKDSNTPGRETEADGGVFGTTQLAWLKSELAASRATWKVIAADLPIGLIVPDGTEAIEGIAQGEPGAPLGRELEIADLLSFIKHRRVTGTVWLTADVHYTAAHYYDPARASFTDFEPFWEFVSGPLNSGGFGPNTLEPTFGPQAKFVAAPPVPNTSPAQGYQFFGEVEIDGASEVLTVRLRDLEGAIRYAVDLDPLLRRS